LCDAPPPPGCERVRFWVVVLLSPGVEGLGRECADLEWIQINMIDAMTRTYYERTPKIS
jgi:hypothetical protein